MTLVERKWMMANWPEPTVEQPSTEDLMEWMDEGYCLSTDGCQVEADCTACPHGYPSWLVYLGLI